MPVLFASIGLIGVALGVVISLTTDDEHTFLIGESFGADTAVAWCTTVAVVGFFAANLAMLIDHRARRDEFAPLVAALGVVFIGAVGAMVVAFAWLGVDRYTVGASGMVIREQPGLLSSEHLVYERDGIVLTLIDRGF